MDKDLRRYRTEIQTILTAFEKQPHLDTQRVKLAYDLHIEKVKDFQHERLVHLLVTFFFAAVMLAAFVALGVTTVNTTSLAAFTLLLAGLTVLLLVTTLFYVYHYYQLENGTQKLYKETDRFIALLQKSYN